MAKDRKSATTGSEEPEVTTEAPGVGSDTVASVGPAGEDPVTVPGPVSPRVVAMPEGEVTVLYDGSRGLAIGVPVRDGAETIYFAMGRPKQISGELARRLVAAKKGFEIVTESALPKS